MNTNTTLSKGSWIQLNERRAARTGILLLLLLTLPAAVQAQFNYTTNNGAITITKYTGPGGAVTIPSTTNGLPVTSIGEMAFWMCTSLTSVTIPNSVTRIGDDAFNGCSSLTSLSIPDGVTSIGNEEFSGCTSLGSVTIGNSVTNIGNYAFSSCTSLTSITIPNSVICIGDSAFGACIGLMAITVDALNPAYNSVDGVLFNNSRSTLVQYPAGKTGSYTVPISVASIGNGAFYRCASLTNITIPNGVINIGKNAFEGCRNLASITIPNSVTNIGYAAFYECASLTSVTIGNKVTSIADQVFESCTSLTNATIGTNVTSIGVQAFSYCLRLTNITIPNSVTSIGSMAFLSCGLTSVRIPDSVTSIGGGAFGRCDRLSAITVDALNAVYSSADRVLFDKGQTTLIQYPGAKAGSYSVPNSVTSIGNGAFENCTGLTNITIPNGVTNIGYAAFVNCQSLTNATIGTSVTSIGEQAFFSCYTLTGVYFLGNAPSLGGSYVFTGDNNATVYYLPGTTGWGPTFGGRPTALWIQVPIIQTPPQTQTAETGSAVGLWVEAGGALPLFCAWYLNGTNLISCSTNCELDLTSVQFSQSGAYTAVISNTLGAVTSAPAMLNVIAAVERRPVPGVKVMGQTGSLLNVDYADSLSRVPNWTMLSSVSLASTSQYYFDLTLPLPPQRFYRAWQTGTPNVMPSLDLHPVPAITLTGSIGGSVRVDYINQFGPIDAWVTLDTVTLTNPSQLYFDVSALGQATRLYRLVHVP
jgi:hypothetical protein